MKSKLPYLLPVALAVAIVGFYFAVRPSTRIANRPATGRVQSAPESARTEATVEPTPLPLNPPRAVGGFVERLLSKNGPDEMGPLADEVEGGKAKLTPEEIQKLRDLIRNGGSQLHRHMAILTLARLPDPDGKNYEALRDACYFSDEFLSSAALGELRTYVESNPESARAVNAFLLGFVRSSAIEETRLTAVSSLRFDALNDGELTDFTTLLNDTSEELRLAVVYSVGGSMGGARKEHALRLLSGAYFSDPSMRVKQQIIECLGEQLVMGKDDEARRALSSLLGGTPELDPEIEQALQAGGD